VWGGGGKKRRGIPDWSRRGRKEKLLSLLRVAGVKKSCVQICGVEEKKEKRLGRHRLTKGGDRIIFSKG